MKKVIATLKLAPGSVGYFDPVSNVYLTIDKNRKDVYEGTDCTELRAAFKRGGCPFVIESGSIEEQEAIVEDIPAPVEEVPKAEVTIDEQGITVVGGQIVEPAQESEAPAESNEEAEAPKPKRSTKKKGN
jgi:hypothetical protein